MNTSLWQIIIGSGVIGIQTWLLLLLLGVIGIVSGTFSIVAAQDQTTHKCPLTIKLLICCIFASILTGAFGTITGYVNSFAALGSTTGAAKAQTFQLWMSHSRISFHAALISSLIQAIFLMISWSLIHFKSKKLSISNPLALANIKKIPILSYAIAITFIPVAIGITFSMWCIEEIVQLQPDEHLPATFGISFPDIMNTCFISGCVGVILLFLFMIITIIKNFNQKGVSK